MAIIKQLSPVTISRIAAGEVVERPAAAIKELIENSLDAGSTEIKIKIEGAGKNLITVQDNGHGMSKEDLYLAADRHTTSKLIQDDLLNIKTFGFRGEALPSIGSISRMTIKSRAINLDEGWCLKIIGGEKHSLEPCSISPGTCVEIRDLFFATPARLKFLRTDKTELNHINEIIKRIALVNPNVKFTFIVDGKEVIRYDVPDDLIDGQFSRIAQIIGKEFSDNAINIHSTKDQIHINGFISLPTFNRGTANDIYLYVNNRCVKDKILQMAIRIAYQDFISSDRFPVAALFINLPYEYVDVNVHPAKTEVRFRDVPLIRNILISSLKNAIYEKGQKTSNTIASDTLNYAAKNLVSTPKYTSTSWANSSNFTHKPSITSKENLDLARGFFEPTAQNYTTPEIQPLNSSVTDDEYPLGAAVCQLHETYIISQTKESIIIVDQHAAHERLLYEKLKNDILNNNIEKQRLLIPEIIEVDSYNLDKILGIKVELLKLGLNITKYTEKSLIVQEIPHLLGHINVKKMVQDIIDDLIEFDQKINFDELLNHILATYACHHSIRSGRKMNVSEMNSLLREMEATPHSGQCNHGRPTYIELKLTNIEKLFGRS